MVAGETGQGRRVHDAALAMAGFRPGVRKQDEDAAQRIVRQAIQQQPGVVAVQPDVAEAAPLDPRREFRSSGEEGLAADHADVRMALRLPSQMLASAEADFQPEVFDACREQAGRGERRLVRDDLQLGKEPVHEVALPLPQSASALSTVQDPAAFGHRASPRRGIRRPRT